MLLVLLLCFEESQSLDVCRVVEYVGSRLRLAIVLWCRCRRLYWEMCVGVVVVVLVEVGKMAER